MLKIKKIFISFIVMILVFLCSMLTQASDIGYPPENDYDEILLIQDGYMFCKKEESGFSSYALKYGVYSIADAEWVFPYTELPFKVWDGILDYTGQGTFCVELVEGVHLINPYTDEYNYYDVYNIQYSHGVSLSFYDLGFGYIKSPDGSSVIAPSCELRMIDLAERVTTVNLEKFGYTAPIYWEGKNYAASYATDDLFAAKFDTLDTDNKLYVYLYDDEKEVLIDNSEFISRITNDSSVSFENEMIRINHMKGDDGEYYYALFDQNGSLVEGPVQEIEQEQKYILENVTDNEQMEVDWSDSNQDYLYTGTVVEFGTWQGMPLQWYVLESDDNKVALMTKDIITCQSFNETDHGFWYESTLRCWLNGYGPEQNNCGLSYADINFLDEAFTREEQEKLHVIKTDSESRKGTVYTEDRVIVLSEEEYDTLVGTEYFSTFEDTSADFTYWLRTPGFEIGLRTNERCEEVLRVQYFESMSSPYMDNSSVDNYDGVRPVIVVDSANVTISDGSYNDSYSDGYYSDDYYGQDTDSYTDPFFNSEQYDYALRGIDDMIQSWCYDDFDHDGEYEAFVGTGDFDNYFSEDGEKSLWFIDSNGNITCLIDHEAHWYLLEDQKQFVFDDCSLLYIAARHGYYGLFGVKDNMPVMTSIPGNFYWIKQEYGMVTAADKRDEWAHVLEFDKDTMSFIDTGETVLNEY